jgi:hypothetical protein
MSSSAVSASRKICEELVESAAELPATRSWYVGFQLSGMTEAKDPEMKTWSLSLMNKLARAMRTLPPDDSGAAAARLSVSLSYGYLADIEHQRAAAEVIHCLVDESNPISDWNKRAMEHHLGLAIGNGMIAPELISRFQASLSRVKQMKAISAEPRAA